MRPRKLHRNIIVAICIADKVVWFLPWMNGSILANNWHASPCWLSVQFSCVFFFNGTFNIHKMSNEIVPNSLENFVIYAPFPHIECLPTLMKPPQCSFDWDKWMYFQIIFIWFALYIPCFYTFNPYRKFLCFAQLPSLCYIPYASTPTILYYVIFACNINSMKPIEQQFRPEWNIIYRIIFLCLLAFNHDRCTFEMNAWCTCKCRKYSCLIVGSIV